MAVVERRGGDRRGGGGVLYPDHFLQPLCQPGCLPETCRLVKTCSVTPLCQPGCLCTDLSTHAVFGIGSGCSAIQAHPTMHARRDLLKVSQGQELSEQLGGVGCLSIVCKSPPPNLRDRDRALRWRAALVWSSLSRPRLVFAEAVVVLTTQLSSVASVCTYKTTVVLNSFADFTDFTLFFCHCRGETNCMVRKLYVCIMYRHGEQAKKVG